MFILKTIITLKNHQKIQFYPADLYVNKKLFTYRGRTNGRTLQTKQEMNPVKGISILQQLTRVGV